MAVRWAITSGTWSSTSTWNDGATLGIPTVGDDVFTNGFTVTMDVNTTVNSLNNSSFTPRLSNTAIPRMINNTSPSGIANASTNSTNAFIAFNRDYNYRNNWQSSVANTGWVSYQFPTSIIIKRYTLQGGDDASAPLQNGWNPRNWTFEGSNDGSSWTVLETVVGFSLPYNGNYVSPILSNTTPYLYYRVNVTAVQFAGSVVRISEIEMTESVDIVGGAAGGSFNFNTGGVTVNITGATPMLASSPIINVTAISGDITINFGGEYAAVGATNTHTITHTSSCNLFITGQNFRSSGFNSSNNINKTGVGSLSIVGNLICAASGTGVPLFSNNGNISIFGNVVGSGNPGAQISNGTLTMVGNITGGAGATGLVHSGPSAIITGNVIGGSTNTNGIGLSASAPTTINGNIFGGSAGFGVSFFNGLTVNGNVFGSNVQGIISSLATTVNINGDVTSSVSANAIVMSNASAVVNLTGNMYNTLGRMAIWCPNVFISNTATTLWRMDIGGGATRTLYSVDSFPNLPSVGNVRSGIGFGPASGLTGTMIVPTPSNVRVGVLTDNTVGTANITAQDILNFINTSSDPLAVRMRTMLTDNSAGQLISEYNFV